MVVTGDELLKQARELLEKGERLDIAAEQLNKLLNHSIHGRGSADVILFYLGCVHMKLNNNALAIILFKEALNHRQDMIEAVNNLGYVYKNEQLEGEAKKCFDRVLKLVEKHEESNAIAPDDLKKWKEDKADYLTNSGSLLIANGTPREALEYFDKAMSVCDTRAQTKWNMSLAYLEMGNYEEGFRYFDYGDRMTKTESRHYGVPNLPMWDGTPNKTVVVYGEQGIGDEIMFASMLPDAMKDCRIIFDAHPRLTDIFRRNFPTVPVYGTRKTDDSKIGWSRHHKPDAKIAIGSLGKFYRKKESDFPRTPYLVADPELVQKYALRLKEMGDKPKIGISWQGGVASTHRENRFIPLDFWLDILRLEGFDFISLQYNKDIGDAIKHFEDTNGLCINHWQDTLDDYDETAGLVSNLDLIISVPQSVVHLAGALGVPTWQLTPFKAMWQMGAYGKEMPWYGCTRNIWQDDKCQWEPVMEKVKGDLCNL